MGYCTICGFLILFITSCSCLIVRLEGLMGGFLCFPGTNVAGISFLFSVFLFPFRSLKSLYYSFGGPQVYVMGLDDHNDAIGRHLLLFSSILTGKIGTCLWGESVCFGEFCFPWEI